VLRFKESDLPVTRLGGRTSIAILFHNHLRAPAVGETDRVADVLERAAGGAVSG